MSDLDTLVRNLRILLRADLIIAELHLRRLMRKSVLCAVAFVIGAFGLVMLGIAGFMALEEVYGRVVAAAIMGGVGIVLALVLVWLAGRVRNGEELALAREVHATALVAVGRNLKDTGANVSQFASFTNNPLQAALPGLAMQFLGIVLKRLRRRWQNRNDA